MSDDRDDPMGRGGAISNILAEARASLKNPSRPFTPADNVRSLFNANDYRPSSRPSSSFSVSSSNFFGDAPPAGKTTSPRKFKGGVSSRNNSRNRSRNQEGSGSNSGEGIKPPLAQSAQNWGGWANSSADVGKSTESIEAALAADENRNSSSRPPVGRRRKSKKAADETGPSPWETSPTVSEDGNNDRALANEVQRRGEPSCAAAIEALLPSLIPSVSVGDLCDLCNQLSPLVDQLPGSGEEWARVLEVQEQALEAVCKLMVNVPPKLLVKLARIALNLFTKDWLDQESTAPRARDGIRPGEALRNIFQLLLRLSKDEANDALFREEKAATAILALLNQVVSSTRSRARRAKRQAQGQAGGEGEGEAQHIVGLRPGDLPFPFDALIYACGTLKNVSQTSEGNQKALSQEGAVGTLAAMLELASPGGLWFKSAGESKAAQLLVQLTATLRNLSLNKKLLKPFWDSDVVSSLCSLLGTLKMHTELCLNIARTLAKLTHYEQARAAVNKSPANLLALIDVLRSRRGRNHALDSSGGGGGGGGGSGGGGREEPVNALVVRVCFTLGNLTSGNEPNRQMIGQQGLEVMMAKFTLHAKKYAELRKKEDAELGRQEQEQKQEGEGEGEGKQQEQGQGVAVSGALLSALKEEEDVLMKLVRVLANLAISPQVGPLISTAEGIELFVPVLEQSFAAAAAAHGGGRRHSAEELMLNTVSAITNLSFYGNPGTGGGNGSVWHLMVDMARALLPVLLSVNEEAAMEAARAFGNLSRDAEVRDFMTKARADEVLVLLLDHSNRDVVFTATGVVTNLAGDEAHKATLTDHALGAPEKLVGILRSASMTDLPLAMGACRALYNILYDDEQEEGVREMWKPSAVEVLGPIFEKLYTTLSELLEIYEDDESEDEDEAVGSFVEVCRTMLQLLDRAAAAEEEEDTNDMVPLEPL